MARRQKDKLVDWSVWDSPEPSFTYKQRNEELLKSGDPLWTSILNSQAPEIKSRILSGQLSLEELEQARVEDNKRDASLYSPRPPDASRPFDEEAKTRTLTPEEAQVNLEAEPITSRFEALRSQFGGTRDVMAANRDFEDLEALRKYERPETRQAARKELQSQISRYLGQRGLEGASAAAQAELEKVEAAEELFSTPGAFDRELQRIGSQRVLGGREAGRAEQYYEQTGNIGTRTIGDVASNLESGLSILGGVGGGALAGPGGATVGAAVGSAPMAKIAYDSAYTEARLAGADINQARTFATAMSGSEFVLEALGGKIAGKLGASTLLKNELKRRFPELAGKKAIKAAAAGAGGLVTGYLEEAGTSALQDLGSLAASKVTDDPNFSEFLSNQISRSEDGSIDVSQVLSDWNRAGLAGSAQAGPVTAAGSYMGSAIEESRKVQQAVLNNTVGNEAAKARYAAIIEAANKQAEVLAARAAVPVQGELFGGESSPVSFPKVDTLTPQKPAPLPLQDRANKILEIQKKKQADTEAKAWQGMEADRKRLEKQKREDTNAFMATYLEKNPGASAEQVALAGTQFESTWKPTVKPPQEGSKKPQETTSPGAKAPPAPTAKPAPTSSQEATAVPEKDVQGDLLKKIEGLSSERKPETLAKTAQPKGRVKKIIQHLARAGKADTEDALELINKGKLGIVETEADLPDGLEKGRDGWYDPASKRVWLVAENLSPKTLRGTALHEINHFLNRNKKDQKTSTGIRKLISGNVEAYNNRIKNLAKSGNKVAQRALERAEASGNVEEELTSYFASESLDAISNKGVLGMAGQIFRDIKSSINTTARDKGVGALTDNDISYILRRQIEDAPSTEFTDGGDARPAESIIGERASGFREQTSRNPERMYRGALDNRKRIEISDRKAELSPNYKKRITDGTFLGAALKHQDLFDNYQNQLIVEQPNTKQKIRYGSLKSAQVKIQPNLPDGMAYDFQNDTIYVSPSALDLSESTFKSYLLHEIQHAIQARESFTNGANYNRLLEEERQILKNKLGTTKLPDQADYIARQRAWTKYDRAYGEAEARLSETNYTLTEDELSQELPEERFSERYMEDEGKYSVRRLPGNRATPGSRPISRALDSIKAERGGEFEPELPRLMATELHHNGINDQNTIRMVRNYLSRWAGTPNNPVKNIRTPDGYTIEELEDAVLEPLPAWKVKELGKAEGMRWVAQGALDKVPDNTPIWGGMAYVTGEPGENRFEKERAYLKYLSHIGDYLLTVPPEKLGQYDLTRAIRETAAQDEENKKKAEKAKVLADKNLETYIQFPDGWRWVRLNKPGQFAAESDIMGHSVRGYEPNMMAAQKEYDTWQWEETLRINKTGENKLLNKIPTFNQWLKVHRPEMLEAGEGGHPNYGYGGWKAIKDDTARIYSLRDPSGKSAVTVELGKTADPFDLDEGATSEELLDYAKSGKFEVSQIKGRFNAAPPASTHPKTQDLLRNLNEEGLLDTTQVDDYRNAGLAVASDDIEGVGIPVYFIRDFGNLDPIFNQSPITRRVSRGLESRVKKGFSDKSSNVWDSTGFSLVKLFFDPNKGITSRGLETRDYWRLKSGGIRELAEGYTVRINHALKKDNHDPDKFEAAVERAEAEPDAISRDRAMDALVRNYGDAAKEYRMGRMLIDNLSKDIAKDWYNEIKKTGRKASKAELDVMTAVVENVGKYSTRVYLSNIPRIGKDYAKSLMKKYDKGDPDNKYFKIVQNAVDYLTDHEVGIPDKETLMRRNTETVRRTYQTWIGPGENLSKEEMVDQLLAKKSSIGENEVDSMVRKTVREMLGLDDSDSTNAVARYYRGGALDKGILQEREKVPPEIRKLLGEVTDPAQKILVTASAQADLLFKNRMLNDFYDNFEGKLWIKPGDRAKTGNEKFSEKLSGETYGPLDGMYVTKPFAYAIKSARANTLDLKEALSMAGLDVTLPGQAIGAKVAKGIGTLSTAQKMSKTALDLGAWALNAMGSPLALLKNGQLLGASKGSREGLQDAVTLALQNLGVEHKKNPEVNKRLSVLLEHGLPDSVFTAELRDSEKEFYEKLLTDLNRGVLTNPRKLLAGGKKGLRNIRDNYGLLDSWVKIADFYGQQQYLTDYYKAANIPKTEDEINREAADIVKFRNITYSRSPIAIQTLERSGATVFATFASEVVRTMITTPYTIKMALTKAKEAPTPEARNIALAEATKVGVGYTTAVALLPAVTHMLLNQVFNGEDDEEKAKEERERFLKLGFPQDQDQSYYVLGKNASGGTVMFNASRTDPHGHVTDFVRQAAQSDDPDEYWDSVKQLFTNAAGNGYMDDVINLARGQGPTTSGLADMLPAPQREFQDLFENLDADRTQADRLTRVLDNFVPGTVSKIASRGNSTVVTSNSSTDQSLGNLMAASGMRMTVIDPKKIAGFEANRYNNVRATAVKQFNELMNREGLEREDVVRTSLNIYTSEQEAARRLAEVYSGLDTEIAGVNPRKTLEDANVSPEDVNDAALARYRSVVLSRSRLNEQEKRQLGQAKTPEARAKLRENYRLARETLAELNLETR